MRKGICIFVLTVLLGLMCGCSMGQDKETQEQIFAMDTVMKITIYGPNGEEKMDEVRALIQKYDKMFSTNVEESDISHINEKAGLAVKVSKETYDLIKKSLEMSKRTDGLFDISIYPVVKAWGFTTGKYRVVERKERKEILKQVDYKKIECLPDNQVRIAKGMSIDLGGIAKGYTSDQIIKTLKAEGVESAIVSLGGNVQTLGIKPDGDKYNVGITNPLDKENLLGTLAVQDECVITSGNYERYFDVNGTRYHHIMDVRTGAPAENDLASVSIIGKQGADADALSTALFVMGSEKAMAYQKAQGDFDVLLVKKDGKIILSEGVKDCFVPMES